jgi:hypothetical protein
MDALCQLLNCKQKFITPYTPQSSGLIERNQRTVLNLIRKIIQENNRNWVKSIPVIEMAINSTVSKATGYSPYRLMTGREFNDIESMIFGNYDFTQYSTAGQYSKTPIYRRPRFTTANSMFPKFWSILRQKPNFKISLRTISDTYSWCQASLLT